MKKLINKYRKWNPSIYATILLMIVPFLMYLLIDFKLDNDFWFLINTGKTILKEGFITVETFTIHSSLSFIPQQWLTDIIFYLIYSKFDIHGIYYLTILCNIVIVYLSYKLCLFVSKSNKKSILITIIIDSFLIATQTISTRPQMFDIIVFISELFILEKYVFYGNKKYLYYIPLLSLVLINAHASMWLMLFVFMIPYIAEYIIKKIRKEATFNIKPLLIIIVVSFLIGFVNPYGIEAIKYLFNSYGIKEINSIVLEMMPLTITSKLGLLVYSIIFILLFSFYKNKGNNKIRYFLLSLGVIFLSLSHFKATLYLMVVSIMVFGYNFKSNVEEKKVKVSTYEKIIYYLLTIASLTFIVFKTKLDYNVDIIDFADYLDKNANFEIKLYTDYNTGGYMEYRGYKCYIDPRAEVFLKSNNHKEDIFVEYYKLENYDIDVLMFLDKYKFDYLLVGDDSKVLLKELQRNKDYKVVYSKIINFKNGEKYYLFENISNNKNT